ncbi:MAG: Crp/Fnr family transcriptional regulator [Polyangiales bacterium]
MSADLVATKREALNAALHAKEFDVALGLYDELDVLEETEPRWPHRKGDLYRRIGHDAAACTAYTIAVERYSALGFVARAAALAKLIVRLDPAREAVLDRVDVEPAKAIHRQERGERAPLKERALPLVPTDSADDEVRFADVADSVELDLRGLGLSDPPPPMAPSIADDPHDVGKEPRRRKSEDLARLPAMPLFAEIPAEAVSRLLIECTLVELQEDDLLIRIDEPADALYIICEGEAQVLARFRDQPVRIQEGDVVGTSCLLDDVTRRADVCAMTPLTALRISKSTLDETVKAHPEVGHVLEELLSRRLVANFLQTSPMFAAFDAESRQQLSRLFELRSASFGTQLLEKGKRSDGVYIVLIGQLAVSDDLLGPGGIVGQRSLLVHEPSEDTVECVTDAMLLRLPRERFAELASLYPPVLATLTELIQNE